MKKIIPLLIIITLAFGAVSATSFPAPTAPAPAGNIVPVHTGASQTKNGSLSVNTFIARAVASFQQQIYINNTNLDKTDEGEKGNLKGSSVSTAENANLVIFGGVIENDPDEPADDVIYDTSIIGTDIITAQNFLQSWNVSHDASIATKRDLCADAEGNVVFCKVAIAEIDVCANIQGTQTNSPTGMVRNGENCEWVLIVPVVPSLGVASISVVPHTFDGFVYNHVQCYFDLNKENDTGNKISIKVDFRYSSVDAGNNIQGSCYPEVEPGQTQGSSQPDQLYWPATTGASLTINSSCVDMSTVPQAVSIPTSVNKC